MVTSVRTLLASPVMVQAVVVGVVVRVVVSSHVFLVVPSNAVASYL